MRIVQINFKFKVQRAQYEQTVLAMADPIAAVKGLRWKVWLMNERESEAGGIYLFDDETSANGYLDGPIVSEIAKHPALENISVKQFDAMEAHTRITRGPLLEVIDHE